MSQKVVIYHITAKPSDEGELECTHGRQNLFSPRGVRWSNVIRKSFQAPKLFVKLKTFFWSSGWYVRTRGGQSQNCKNIAIFR